MSRWSAVFLDRDGTLNVKAPEGQYVTTPDGLVLLPGVASAVRRLNASGALVFVVTNQRGVARGLMSRGDLDSVHERLVELLRTGGVSVDGIYVCDHDHGACECRKPLPGLLRQVAAARPEIELARSAMVGDAASDVAAGAAAGCVTIRLADAPDPAATTTVRSLPEAVDWLLS